MKKLFQILFLILLSQLLIIQTYAEYVLPYPSFMPGNKLYKISHIIDKVKNFWYFGDISQIKLHMDLSDKYLVEAKTLLEYKQYLIGLNALKRSDSEFLLISKNLISASKNRKDISKFKIIICQEADKHREILRQLEQITPYTFIWSPEKSNSTELHIHLMLKESEKLHQCQK